jgi:AcrR family transcriptional regulator
MDVITRAGLRDPTQERTAPGAASPDGRTARRERNRAAVVDAVLGLIDEGHLEPGVDQITDRSGVSPRSIFRYFDGLDDLRADVIRRQFERMAPLAVVSRLGQGPLEERIERLVDARLALFEAIRGPARAARLRAAALPAVADGRQAAQALLDDQVRAHFARELRDARPKEADDLAALVGVLLSFDAWEVITAVQGRTRAQVRRAWIRGLGALLAPRGKAS